MKTTNNEAPMEYEIVKPDPNAMKQRLEAYRKLGETMQKAADIMNRKGGAKS